mmetsp:Transcript_10513/g.15767  ORF Transcript_10513/g.15767 Transcript_10513/m.15767 type:complete len:203 (+) Transcript_10513:155-763(+)|eukprot:CAMPEP_0171462644 /NCGR_PEP_ID=MMETSP0945-20130129/6596_1 /TAXON_ID=109269 /ORGANISM="Vaucheria litorea, Strain CCMP2940" /LENGTH=202 /DNA_ID=CAMNT_0011989205 /DNA_START=138 /DNA_END=746 /DNA_ORIENTATION=-
MDNSDSTDDYYSPIPWFVTTEGLYEVGKNTYSTVSRWPIISLYARTGECLTGIAVSAGSSLLGGRKLLGLEIPKCQTRENLCTAIDTKMASIFQSIDYRLEDPLEEFMDKIYDFCECAGVWCKCTAATNPIIKTASNIITNIPFVNKNGKLTSDSSSIACDEASSDEGTIVNEALSEGSVINETQSEASYESLKKEESSKKE